MSSKKSTILELVASMIMISLCIATLVMALWVFLGDYKEQQEALVRAGGISFVIFLLVQFTIPFLKVFFESIEKLRSKKNPEKASQIYSSRIGGSPKMSQSKSNASPNHKQKEVKHGR